MFALPFADWISEHLMEMHGVGFESGPTYVPFLAFFMLIGILKFIVNLKWDWTFIIAIPYLIIMILVETSHGVHVGQESLLGSFGIGWHVIYLWIATGIVLAITMTAAKDEGEIPGKLRLGCEAALELVRDNIVRPIMGKDGDNYMPYLMSFFTLILMCNLLGLTPASTTVTGNIFGTLALALLSVVFYHGMGIAKYGFVQHWINIVPVHADVRKVGWFLGTTIAWMLIAAFVDMGPNHNLYLVGGVAFLLMACGKFGAEAGEIALWLFMFFIEFIGHLAKPFALCVRLFANMMGGHAVLYVCFGMVFTFKSLFVGFAVTLPASFAITMLELMVAVIQAYVFTLLTALFLQGTLHPEH